MSSPLEAALARIKKREESLWGKAQIQTDRWLARLESSPFFQRYGKLKRPARGIPSLRADPAIDLESLFVISLLFHLLLLFLLAQIAFRPPFPARPEPIVVHLLESVAPSQERTREPRKKAKRKALSRKRTSPPPARPQPAPPKLAEPAPPPAPSLPAPKALAQTPLTKGTGFASQPADSLIRLPTRSPKTESTTLATSIDPLPESLAQPRGLLSEPSRSKEGSQPASPGGSGKLAALSSPDFGPYLEKIKRKVQSAWNYPQAMSGNHKVEVLFVVDRGGKLVRAEVLGSSDRRLDNSALKAMHQASPFPPIPDSLKELAGAPLIMKFSIDFGVKLSH